MTETTDLSLSAFLRGLPRSSSKPFTPFAEYDHTLQMIMVRTRDCSVHTHPLTTFRETDILLASHSKQGESAFAGFQLWINPCSLLENRYRAQFRQLFPLYRVCYNALKVRERASDVVALVTDLCPDMITTWGEWKPHIDYTLNTYKLGVHIPLKIPPRV